MKWMTGFIGLLLGLHLFSSAIAETGIAANPEVLDIAHRGYAAQNPESTLQAFQSAHQQGADGIEFDVRQTQDKVLVITHDANIAALANRSVESVLFSDLYMATDIPSLEEVLRFAERSGQVVWLEIKQSHRYPGIIDGVLALIDKYGLEDRAIIQSFNHNDLRHIKRKNPNLRLLALYSSGFSLSRVSADSDFIGLPISQAYLDPSLIRRLHQAGKQVIFWRRDNRSESKQVLQQFIDAGADGFMLDRSLKVIMQGG